jgi:hypothetical protein
MLTQMYLYDNLDSNIELVCGDSHFICSVYCHKGCEQIQGDASSVLQYGLDFLLHRYVTACNSIP